MDQEKVLNIARDYAASVRKVIDAADVFLYGSYARGVSDDIEPVLLTADDDKSGFLSTVRKTGIAV